MMLTRNCSLSYRQHLSMTAVGKSHFSRKIALRFCDRAWCNRKSRRYTLSKNPFTKNFGGRTRSQIVQQLNILHYLELWQLMESTTRRFTTTSSRNECMCITQANTEAKKFVDEDGVLHYITKEWMHKCFQKKEMQPFPLTRSSHPDSPASPELLAS